jgi:surfeit locus 1 family protein
MMRRLPLVPTVIVVMAVATMIALGVWQLGRSREKAALLASYASAERQSAEVNWPLEPAARAAALFRRASLDCKVDGKDAPIAGYNRQGTLGWAHTVTCLIPGGARAEVVLGWSRDLAPRAWTGGQVSGVIAPGAGDGVRLIADPPLAGLAASARPDPASVPNNHLSYAVQWFLFATMALVIYGLALRKRLAARDAEG